MSNESNQAARQLIVAAQLCHQHHCGEGGENIGCGVLLQAWGRPPGSVHPVSGVPYGNPNEVWSCSECVLEVAEPKFVTRAMPYSKEDAD